MKRKQKRIPEKKPGQGMVTSQWRSLMTIAIGSAALWRVEVELHGWEGLKWLSYFHWAVPVGVLAFIGWAVYWVTFAAPRRRLWFAATLLVAAGVMYPVVYTVLSMAFMTGPFTRSSMGELLYVIWPLIPVVSFSVFHRFTGLGTLKHLGASVALFGAAVPLSMTILLMTGHRGQADMIHAIKSGIIVPWLVIALGIPYLFTPVNRMRRTDEENGKRSLSEQQPAA